MCTGECNGGSAGIKNAKNVQIWARRKRSLNLFTFSFFTAENLKSDECALKGLHSQLLKVTIEIFSMF